MCFNENLKRYREKAGLTRQDIAEKIHMTANGYGLYETGRSEPKLDTLKQIADVLNVSTDVLLGRSTVSDIPKSFNELGFWLIPSSWEGWVIVSANEQGHEELDNLFSVPRDDLEKIMLAAEADAQKFKRSKLLAALKEVQATSHDAFYNKMIDEIKQKDIGDVEKKESIDFLKNLLTKKKAIIPKNDSLKRGNCHDEL